MTQFTTLHKIIVTLLLLLASVTSANELNTPKDYDCVIIPSNVANLGSNSRGVINHIAVDRNDFVKRGDVIAVLDDKVEQASVTLASKQASLVSDIALSKVNLAYAQREQARAKKAYQAKAYSLHDYDVAKVETELAKIKLLQAKEKKVLADNELKRAQAQLAHKTIRAPFSGVVTERLKVIGEYIDDEAVITLAQLDPLHVEVIVPVLQHGKIKVGMQAAVCTDTQQTNDWHATVTQVDQVMDAASGTFGVRLSLPNPDYKIPAGLRCNLKFIDPVKQATNKNTEHKVHL